MLLSRLAETRIALTATRSRNAKRELIAAVLREASPEDVEIVVSYLSGSLRQRRTGVGWKSLQSIPPPADEALLTVGEVDEVFEHVSGLSGAGSAAARAAAVNALLARATSEEQDLLRGLVFGELRQGAMEAAVQEGLAAAFDVPVAAVRRAAMLLSSTTAAAAMLLTGGWRRSRRSASRSALAFSRCWRPALQAQMLHWTRPGYQRSPITSWMAYACKCIAVAMKYGSSPAAWTTSPPGSLRLWRLRDHLLMISSYSTARCSRCEEMDVPKLSRSWRPAR